MKPNWSTTVTILIVMLPLTSCQRQRAATSPGARAQSAGSVSKQETGELVTACRWEDLTLPKEWDYSVTLGGSQPTSTIHLRLERLGGGNHFVLTSKPSSSGQTIIQNYEAAPGGYRLTSHKPDGVKEVFEGAPVGNLLKVVSGADGAIVHGHLTEIEIDRAAGPLCARSLTIFAQEGPSMKFQTRPASSVAKSSSNINSP